MNIQHKTDERKGEFYIEEAGEKVAEMTYVMAGPQKMIIDHTYVADKLRGKGVGQQLVEKAVAYARAHNIKINPLCPFAKAVMEREKAFHDVLA